MNRFRCTRFLVGVIVLTLLSWLLYCAVNPVTKKREFMLLTESDELALGKDTDQQIIATYGIYENPNLLSYVSTMGKKMGTLSHRPQLDYQFRILDTPVINAFAVPGGFIYMTRGILAYLNNDAELAGVVGHEMGHVTARHSAKQYSKAQLAQLGIGLGVALSETFRKYAGIADFGVGMLFLKFSRDNEREADALGVEYSTKVGYDAMHMANFFNTLERLHPSSDRSGLPEWFSTHPNPPDRIAAVKRDTQDWQTKTPNKNFMVNHDAYLKTVDGIIYGDDPRQGYVEENMFYHPKLQFQFPVPNAWTVNNTPSQVQMFTEKQDAVIIFTLSKESSPSTAANQFITKTGAAVKSSDAMRVNGLTAHQVISNITTDQTLLSVMSFFVQKGNEVYEFHGYCDNSLFDKYLPTFKTTMNQFNRLTDPSKINVQPALLKVKTTSTAGTVRSAFQQFGVPSNKVEEMAVMNGMNLDDTIPAHTLIKIVSK